MSITTPTSTPTPTDPQPRKRNWVRRHPVWSGIIGAALVAGAIGSASSATGSGLTKAEPQVPGATQAPAASAPAHKAPAHAAAPAKPAAPRVIFSHSGDGIWNSPPIAGLANGDTLNYSYGSDDGTQVNFQVYVNASDGTPDAVPVNELKAAGQGSSALYGVQAGDHIEVNSEGHWTVTVSTGGAVPVSAAQAPAAAPAPASSAAQPGVSATINNDPVTAPIAAGDPGYAQYSGTFPSFEQAVDASGIVAPHWWDDATAVKLIADWQAGYGTSYTDQILLAGGLHPDHLALFDSLVEQYYGVSPAGQ
jgi:hypothetical protein